MPGEVGAGSVRVMREKGCRVPADIVLEGVCRAGGPLGKGGGRVAALSFPFDGGGLRWG